MKKDSKNHEYWRCLF